MFWLQIIIPLVLALSGFLLLYVDKSHEELFLKEYLNGVKTKLIDISELQDDKTQVRERLCEVGRSKFKSYGDFRYKQLLLASCCALFPFLALFLMLIPFISAIGLSLFLGASSYFAFDRYLSTLVKRHRERIESEFPAIIEMLTLAIAAGETPISAVSRIADRSDSFLAKEFKKVVQEVRSGKPFHESLDRMGRGLKSVTIRRFVDALVMAMVRGAPVVDVLHRHVAEARINQRNLVMDKAGKAETTMMIPIVFLILPISVLFALWPSINQLSFFAS